jgi:hypothetical protein
MLNEKHSFINRQQKLNCYLRTFTMKALFSFFILLLTLTASAQNFEGTLTFSVEVELGDLFAKMGMSKETLKEEMVKDGTWVDTIRTTYKEGNYINIPNMAAPSKTIYKADSNYIYTFSSDIWLVTDAAIDLEESLTKKAPKVFKRDTVVEVNGKKCSVVRVQWKAGYTDYYYAENTYPMDATLYSKHKYDGWAAYLAIAKALPIRITKSVIGTTTILTLVSSEEKKVDSSIFNIPELEEDESLSFMNKLNMKTMKIKKKD